MGEIWKNLEICKHEKQQQPILLTFFFSIHPYKYLFDKISYIFYIYILYIDLHPPQVPILLSAALQSKSVCYLTLVTNLCLKAGCHVHLHLSFSSQIASFLHHLFA